MGSTVPYLLLSQVLGALAGDQLLPSFDLGKGGVRAFIKMSRSQRFAAKVDEFGEAVGALRNQTSLKNGPNVGNLTGPEVWGVLGARASKGAMVAVENWSRRTLGEPQHFARCGFLDSEFGESPIGPGRQETILVHNYNKALTSSCGSLSWQVMDGPGVAHRLPNGQGLRMFVTWSSLDAVRGNRCATGKRNEFVIGFAEVALDTSGRCRENWRKKSVYKKYHTDDQVDSVTWDTEGNTKTALVESSDGELQVRAVMGPDCLSKMHIELLGKGHAKLQILAPDEDVYTKDEIWEQMVRQAWRDIVGTINRDGALYGVGLAPLEVDPLLPEPIAINQEMVGYLVNLSMWNVSVSGIEEIQLERITLKRGRGLNNLREEAVLAMGDLEVRGMYQYTAECTAWICVISQFDSEGAQPFSIRMTNATFSVNIHMDTVNSCGGTDDPIFSDIQLPLDYSQITFNFTNIGSVLGTAVSLIGAFAIDFGRGLVVEGVKQVVREQAPTLLCEGTWPLNITLMPPLPPTTASSSDSWREVMEAAHGGWGLSTLRRDRLSEMVVNKIWEDTLALHLANTSSPLAKALDPFQLLPASENLHIKGILKGHIVACELFLHGLQGLQLADITLVRNTRLTHSALRLTIEIPRIQVLGKFRLNNVYVMTAFKAKDSEGSIQADLTGVQVTLTVVMNTTIAGSQQAESSITMDNFEVEFKKQKADIKVTGLGGKIIQKLSTSAIKRLGDTIVDMQKATITTEIKTIFWGLAKCLMYQPGQGFNQCMDNFWRCLGFEVPFQFPTCPEMYKTADAEMAKFASYRNYLNDYKRKAAAKAASVEERKCLKKE